MIKKMSFKKIILLVIVLVLLIVLSFPYIKAGYLTVKYGDEFANGYEQTGMIDDIEYFRVIEYNDKEAVVCYIVKNHGALVKIWFEQNEDGVWQEIKWDCVWSKTGSADNFCWPYYR